MYIKQCLNVKKTIRRLRKTRITLAIVNIFINYRRSGCGSDGSMWNVEICGKGKQRSRGIR